MYYHQSPRFLVLFRISLVTNRFDYTERIEGIVEEKEVIESHLPRLLRKRTNPDSKREHRRKITQRSVIPWNLSLVSHFTVKTQES